MSEDKDELICLLFLLGIIIVFWYVFLIGLIGVGIYFLIRNKLRNYYKSDKKSTVKYSAKSVGELINWDEMTNTKRVMRCQECGCKDDRLSSEFCNFCGSSNLKKVKINGSV